MLQHRNRSTSSEWVLVPIARNISKRDSVAGLTNCEESSMQSRTCPFSALTLGTALFFWIASGLSAPASAQQNSERDARQAGENIVQAYNKAGTAKDAAGLAAVYTQDATLVMPDGPLVGRTAIQKYFEEAFKGFTLQAAKLDQATFIGNGQVMIRNGTFTATLQGKDGPMPVKGHWATTDIREDGVWKIRLEADNIAPPPQR